jgi:starch phosphorylase
MDSDAGNRKPERKSSDADVDAFKRRLFDHLVHTVGKNLATVTDRDWYHALARTVRDQLVEAWMDSTRATYHTDAKRVYYLSLEFLIGRSLVNNLFATGFYDVCRDTLDDMGLDLDRIAEQEPEAALGNGGLGRLAACILDSMATVGIHGYGYGIRYDYGMFSQCIEDGWQVELPENWLRYGNQWEFARPEVVYPVKFFGRIVPYTDPQGRLGHQWVDAEEVQAMAFDQPVAGYGAWTVNNVRLWAARASREFDLKRFNQGSYVESVGDQVESEALSRILYPDDTTSMGKALRLKQEYFFVSASLQDVLRRYLRQHPSPRQLPKKVTIQLNDTHPALAIPEMMRLLMDVHGLGWDEAWDVTVKTFSYTNHTLLPEALETWPVALFESMLPRHLQIIYEINHRFLSEVRRRYPEDSDLVRRLSIIDEENGRRVRMANLAFIGSHKVNGVARIHTELMKSTIFADFHRFFPKRIVNKTNGITPRRWLNQANRPLAGLITKRIGERWISDLGELHKLVALADDPDFRAAYRAVKRRNKERLAVLVKERLGVEIDPGSLFDVQVKRIHEYKRQLLNVLHVVTRYNALREHPRADAVPRAVLIAGKAAPGYRVAKLIIKLINDVARTVNGDPRVHNRLKVVFLPNYNVSLAEIIIPAADLSQQISTAGTEASGTGNMKLALNGALTIGTRDGANIEIAEEAGEENVFFFGLPAEEATRLQRFGGHDPRRFYDSDPCLRQALDMIAGGFFSPDDPGRFRPLVDALLVHGDYYLLTADYADYLAAQERVDALWRQPEEWTAKAILNTARMGKFSSDLLVLDYAEDIWQVTAQPLGAHLEAR